MQEKISILGLATCYNRKEKTVAAVEGLVGGNRNIKFSFILTDDASTDGTADALSEYENVTVMHGNGSSFYTGGMRIAMAEALKSIEESERSYDYVMLFNDDVSFYDNSIESLINRGKIHENAVLVGSTCETDEKTLSYGGVVRKSNFRPKFSIVKADTIQGRKVDTFNANCVLIPTELFVKTGVMDKVYNHSLGDFDYGYMLRKKGAELYVFDEYVGICPNNSEKGTWRDASLSRRDRFRAKESIKGVPFGEFFHYLLKNYNFLTAVIYSISPYIRILLGI